MAPKKREDERGHLTKREWCTRDGPPRRRRLDYTALASLVGGICEKECGEGAHKEEETLYPWHNVLKQRTGGGETDARRIFGIQERIPRLLLPSCIYVCVEGSKMRYRRVSHVTREPAGLDSYVKRIQCELLQQRTSCGLAPLARGRINPLSALHLC